MSISSEMPFYAEQQLLRERLDFFLNTLHPLVKADIVYTLTSPGKLLSIDVEHINTPNHPSGMWSLLPLFVAKHFAYETKISYIYSVAVAIECFICALDLLDDIEDADQTEAVLKLGTARVLNVSTTLLALTHHILLSLTPAECSYELIVRLLDAVQKALITSTAGQHRDIMAEQRSVESFTSEECIEIAESKSGSLMSLACLVGALCTNADDHVVAQFAELGKLYGIAQQLDNDSHDLHHILQHEQGNLSTGSVKTDLERQKKTLPVVLAAHTMSTLHVSFTMTDEERQKAYKNALHEGIITTWGISLLYRERAHDQLQQIEMQHPVSRTLRLLLGFV